jgi:hypothetical protein
MLPDNLLQESCHLTSEEDSYGNEKGSQEEIEQQFEKQKLGFVARQQRKEKHPRLFGKEIKLAQIQFEEILGP